MKIVNWNVNGYRARLSQMLVLVDHHQPDVVCIQESKVGMGDLDTSEMKERGYEHMFMTQYNPAHYHGVVTFSRLPIEASVVVEPGRVLMTKIDGTDIFNCYINQGQEVGAEEYYSKLDLMYRLPAFIKNDHTILCGDFNITMDDEDVWSTDHWHNEVVSCTPDERDAIHNLINECDLHHVEHNGSDFTWYSYRQAWRNYRDGILESRSRYGINIDHVLVRGVDVDVQNMIEYRLPETQSEVATSDHCPLMINVLG